MPEEDIIFDDSFFAFREDFEVLTGSMDERERLIANSFALGLKDKDVMGMLNIARQSTYQYQKDKVRSKLRQGLMEYCM